MSAGTGRGRRQLVVTVTSVMAAATLMQYSLSAISPLLIRDLDLSSPEYGSLYTVYFVVCSAGSLLLGGLTQRIGARWGMALVGITASAGLLTVAVASGSYLLYAGLVLSGIAGSLSNPATNLALMHVEDRGPLIGIKQSGVQLSALASGAVVAPLAQVFGWRAAVAMCAVVCLLLIPAAFAIRQGTTTSIGAAVSKGSATSVLGLAMFAFLMGCGLATTIAYLPVYAMHESGLSAGAAGRLLGLFGLCAVIGRVGWGFLSERSVRFGRPNASLGALSFGALLATVLLIAASTGATLPVYLGAALMGLTGASWNGLVMTLVVATTDPAHAGRASGRVQAAFFGGLCVSPLAVGFVVDATGSYLIAWPCTAIVYVLALFIARTRIVSRRQLAAGSTPA